MRRVGWDEGMWTHEPLRVREDGASLVVEGAPRGGLVVRFLEWRVGAADVSLH